ncbi:MAG: hypothetical protein FWD37_03375 [Methanomassiliicoccaceae archaeon]|nr:hypothetical protein [Methanomassiliicoccaceae archaeon]
MMNVYVAVNNLNSSIGVPGQNDARTMYIPPVFEFDPNLLDKDPITFEEEEDLYKSYKDFEKGNITHLSSKCTGEEFLRKLKD